MVDPNTAAYRLETTGRNKTVIFSRMLKPGVKHKVDVKNTSAPFDKLVVDGWLTNDEFGESFVFEDGQLGHTVSLNFADVKHQMCKE